MIVRGKRVSLVLAVSLLLFAVGTAAFIRFIGSGEELFASRWRLIPDDRGTVRLVVCVANSARRAVLRNAPAVTQIVNALPERARVIILTNDRSAFIVASNPNPGRVDIVDLPAQSAFSIWPQDPFLVLTRRRGEHLLLASREFDRADDRLIARKLAKQLGWRHRVSELTFEGGNIVGGSRHVFIGFDTIHYNAERLKLSDADVVRKFQRELGRRVIVLGPLPQPVAHIDMIISPLARDQIVVADPGWGARLARQELRKRPRTVAAFERACEEYYFGDPNIRMLYDRGVEPIKPPNVVGQTSKAVDDSEAIAVHLDKLAEELTKWGYKVHRVPFLFCRDVEMPDEDAREEGDKAPGASPGKSDAPKLRYPCLTYSNVLIENSWREKTVYLPQYGWPTMDRGALQVWQKLGYRVVPVGGLTISSMYGGSLRCCAKVLQRR